MLQFSLLVAAAWLRLRTEEASCLCRLQAYTPYTTNRKPTTCITTATPHRTELMYSMLSRFIVWNFVLATCSLQPFKSHINMAPPTSRQNTYSHNVCKQCFCVSRVVRSPH
eukprot:TRINITY_DN68099_c2_g12_i1.p1 TRINITY_DN68099_c2_g12~~TRINITY_DN68099_c2_g12_i1.p1  ORF type:complete len:111 (+),score=6.75 TRINITY_DN68099_c2_g12_i1:295-627(+)